VQLNLCISYTTDVFYVHDILIGGGPRQ